MFKFLIAYSVYRKFWFPVQFELFLNFYNVLVGVDVGARIPATKHCVYFKGGPSKHKRRLLRFRSFHWVRGNLSVNVQLTYMYQWIEGLWSTTLLFLFTCKSMAIKLYLIIIIIVVMVVVVVVVYIEDITCPHVDMNFIFKCSTRYLTRCLLYKLMFII